MHPLVAWGMDGMGRRYSCYSCYSCYRFRAEKLFPGPHLFAGAAIVVIWAVSAAMVPFMEKGPVDGMDGMDGMDGTGMDSHCDHTHT